MYEAKTSRHKSVYLRTEERCKLNDSSPPIIQSVHVLQTPRSVTQLNNAHRRGREIGIVTKGISLLCMHITLTFLLPLCVSVVDKGDRRPQMFHCQMDRGTTERSALSVHFLRRLREVSAFQQTCWRMPL
jgi:hypothetical protein